MKMRSKLKLHYCCCSFIVNNNEIIMSLELNYNGIIVFALCKLHNRIAMKLQCIDCKIIVIRNELAITLQWKRCHVIASSMEFTFNIQ